MARVLIVDDDPTARRLLEEMIHREGHVAISASGGADALDVFNREEIDLVLVDLRMPEMDGQELIERMRATKQDVSIIVVSGAGTKDDLARAMRAGCYDFIDKPILDYDRFRTTINRAVEQRQMAVREQQYIEQLRASHEQQERQLRQLQLLHEVTTAWQGTFEQDHLLSMVLTCATSGRALGYNRAHVFLVSPEGRHLQGAMALGPSSREEAGKIWSQLASLSLSEQLDLVRRSPPNDAISKDISHISIPIDDSNEILAQCVRERAAFVVNDSYNSSMVGPALSQALRVKEFACAPLIARDEVLGVLIIDNLYTGRPIRQEDIQVLSTFANQAALALATVQSYQRLKRHLVQMQRMQERLIESERVAATGSVAAQVAHEIRNPLFVISGYARRLLNAESANSETASAARIIVQESDRLEQILTRVLNYLHESERHMMRADLNDSVRRAAESVRDTIESHKVGLALGLAPLPVVEVDPQLMEQVVVNLLLNALAATRAGGRIDVRTSSEGDIVRLEVSDTGVGIPAEDLPNLFNPFYSANTSGIGVGLAVVNRIVHSFGGTIRVQSRENEGTVMTVLIPTADAKERESNMGPEGGGLQQRA